MEVFFIHDDRMNSEEFIFLLITTEKINLVDVKLNKLQFIKWVLSNGKTYLRNEIKRDFSTMLHDVDDRKNCSKTFHNFLFLSFILRNKKSKLLKVKKKLFFRAQRKYHWICVKINMRVRRRERNEMKIVGKIAVDRHNEINKQLRKLHCQFHNWVSWPLSHSYYDSSFYSAMKSNYDNFTL